VGSDLTIRTLYIDRIPVHGEALVCQSVSHLLRSFQVLSVLHIPQLILTESVGGSQFLDFLIELTETAMGLLSLTSETALISVFIFLYGDFEPCIFSSDPFDLLLNGDDVLMGSQVVELKLFELVFQQHNVSVLVLYLRICQFDFLL
jgi:hypothetical protein